MKNKVVYLPLTHALAWIVGSTLLISGSSYTAFKYYLKKKHPAVYNPEYAIQFIIQTGPQKEALRTEYLAELLGVSSDKAINLRSFNLEKAKEQLLKSPLLSKAEVKALPPHTLYVDYTVRQPMAWLEDYENIVIDREGYPFPFKPFFSPKNLPAIYMGLRPFGSSPVDPERPKAEWGTPLTGKYLELALGLLQIVTDPQVADLFSVKCIDVSNAFAESYGTREIVVSVEDIFIHKAEKKEIQVCVPRLLRLSTKNYAQELGNYLKLRAQMLDEEKKISTLPETTSSVVRLKEKVIDFRLEKLAFIEEQK